MTGVRELRLALVLYGGVSLAIYMHGVTRELHHLVRASALLDDDPAPRPSERVYRELLEALAEADGVRTRVVVDLIAGTSAGGINGVVLAKALAGNRSQDALREVWLDRGDVGGLLRGLIKLPWQLRLPFVLGTVLWRAALRGDDMLVWLYDALDGMQRTPHGPASLLPPGHDLRLFVTATDFGGYRRTLALGDPPVVHERRHRHVLEFRHGDGEDDFADDPLHTAALAFAARATSSFSGAFPPVSLGDVERVLARRRGIRVDLAALAARRLFRHYPLAGADVRAAHFVDGGVLDNRPFGHVIAGIRERPAAVEVDRRLVYVEPNPAPPPDDQPTTPPAGGAPAAPTRPRPVATVLGSVSGLPRHEPILDDILEVGRMNERVARVQDAIRTSWGPVAAAVERRLQGEDLAAPPADPDDERLRRWRDEIHAEALASTGLGYTTYARVKIGDAVDRLAGTLSRLVAYPADSNQGALVRVILRGWAREQGLFRESATLDDAQVAFLRDFDRGYGERRLRFVIAALSWWYDPSTEPAFPVPDREQLNEGKRRLYEALAELRATMRGAHLSRGLLERVDEALGERALEACVPLGPGGAAGYLATHGSELTAVTESLRDELNDRLAGFAGGVYRDLHELTGDWHPEARRRLLLRYLGFPIWDALLFPLQSVAEVGERDAVDLVRVSPLDGAAFEAPGGRKLAGAALHNFGAFFARARRENDYLWGRLDGAERLVDLLLGGDHPERADWLRRLHAAILDEEADDLGEARGLVAALRVQLGRPAGS